MESKLLVGGKSIIDKTSEQERALEERRKQIAEQQVMTWLATELANLAFLFQDNTKMPLHNYIIITHGFIKIRTFFWIEESIVIPFNSSKKGLKFEL